MKLSDDDLLENPSGDFLDKLLIYSRFTSHSIRPVFLPRKVGLGYFQSEQRVDKEVIRPVLKEARRRAEEKRKVERGEKRKL
ncbi:hypothetical protein PAEPH01_2443, partial [Pancytospora epiphaga]